MWSTWLLSNNKTSQCTPLHHSRGRKDSGSTLGFTDAHHNPHRWDEMQSESEDSEYDTPQRDDGIPEQTSSTTRPVTQNQTRAQQLAQTIQDAWTKAVQYIQCK